MLNTASDTNSKQARLDAPGKTIGEGTLMAN